MNNRDRVLVIDGSSSSVGAIHELPLPMRLPGRSSNLSQQSANYSYDCEPSIEI